MLVSVVVVLVMLGPGFLQRVWIVLVWLLAAESELDMPDADRLRALAHHSALETALTPPLQALAS